MADNAKFSFTTFWETIMDGKEIAATNWSSNDIPNQGPSHSKKDDDWKKGFEPSHQASEMRVLACSKLPTGNAMAPIADVRKFQSILVKTPTHLRYKVTTRSAACETTQVDECWDIYSTDVGTQIAVRHSYKLVVHQKANFIVQSQIEKNMTKA